MQLTLSRALRAATGGYKNQPSLSMFKYYIIQVIDEMSLSPCHQA
jgi:hypothetical protein